MRLSFELGKVMDLVTPARMSVVYTSQTVSSHVRSRSSDLLTISFPPNCKPSLACLRVPVGRTPGTDPSAPVSLVDASEELGISPSQGAAPQTGEGLGESHISDRPSPVLWSVGEGSATALKSSEIGRLTRRR